MKQKGSSLADMIPQEMLESLVASVVEEGDVYRMRLHPVSSTGQVLENQMGITLGLKYVFFRR